MSEFLYNIENSKDEIETKTVAFNRIDPRGIRSLLVCLKVPRFRFIYLKYMYMYMHKYKYTRVDRSIGV